MGGRDRMGGRADGTKWEDATEWADGTPTDKRSGEAAGGGCSQRGPTVRSNRAGQSARSLTCMPATARRVKQKRLAHKATKQPVTQPIASLTRPPFAHLLLHAFGVWGLGFGV